MNSKTIPLLPPEVLEHLLGFLPVASLRSCRLLNSSWAKAAMVPMKKKSVSRTSYLVPGTQDLERFLSCSVASDGKFPVCRFELTMAPFDRLPEAGERSLDQFFLTVSPIVTELTLDLNWKPNLENWPGNHDYPKLTSLKLKVTSYYRSRRNSLILTRETLFDFVQRIISRAPNLDTVSLEFGYHSHGSDVGPCIEAISKHPILREKLTHLHLSYMRKESDFPNMNFLHTLKLKKLQLDNSQIFWDRRGDTFKFLESQADSLEILEILLDVEVLRGILKIPGLRKLQQLKITGAKTFEPLLSSRDFEVLKRVHLQLGTSTLTRMLPLMFQPLPFNSVEELIVEEWGNSETSAGIFQAARLFPNISKLEIGLVASRAVVKAVYQSFLNLVELSLTISNGVKFMDKVLTGLSRRVLHALKLKMNVITIQNQRDEVCRQELRSTTSKSIANLQQLQTLRLRTTSRGRDAPIEFGLVSCFVLKSMKSLKCLDLGVRKFPETDERTKAVLQNLREKIIVTYDDPPVD